MKKNPDNPLLQILIVEDNRTQAEYLRHLLEKKGHMVTITNNGFEALENIGSINPDIILTDVMMPDMDGFTLCKKLKQSEVTSHIPIILVTHLYSPVDVIKGLEAGADNFIIKPFDPENIFSRISSIMLAKNHVQTEEALKPLDVVFSSEVHTISSSRMQILNILLSTYETAVKNNSELQVAHERLHYTNAQLQKVVEDLQQTNESLHLKNLERERLESSLISAQEKIKTISEVINQVISSQVQVAYDALCIPKKTKGKDEAKKAGTDPCLLMLHGIKTLKNAISYLDNGNEPGRWQSIRKLINESIDPIRLQSIRYNNLIPEDVEIYTNPGLSVSTRQVISSLHEQKQKPSEIRFTFHLQESGYAIIVEDNGAGIPESDKERIFSLKEGQNVMPDLYLVKEILSSYGYDIHETGVSGQGIRFEFFCPEGAVRFSSDIDLTDTI
ncbi:response regulator [Methanospirillum stamsii]|uniref:Hybrid sensor histidine kinase/response regulator n=1 Tax=Methanospirillum stamsii TaxID=1277351 RepID=A0A2V2N9W5_9EURY|nr:response regulator [Methanospirillum stamsii]PWR75530.1 hybrid sensor histidine kinase/response regulator [Methanospirillum stamsii]